MMSSRTPAICALGALLLSFAAVTPAQSQEDTKQAWAALASGGHVALIRHANAPGAGDPMTVKIDDCKTQRNLDDVGREQARSLGEAFRNHKIRVDRIVSSPWCRCQETARLMAVGKVETSWGLVPDRGQTPPVRLQELKEIVSSWRGPGTLVLVSHGFAIQALLGFIPGQAEILVLKPKPGSADLVGRIAAPR